MSNLTLAEFIDQVGKAAQSYYPQYKILPSLCIAQALLESNKADYKKGLLSLSGLARECNNFYGMKWNSTCHCDRKAYKTKEWDKVTQQYIEIIAYFRKYPTMSDGIKGYFDFLTYKRYKNLQEITNYRTACELIRTDGWATSPTYTQNLIKRIEDLQLYRYDEPVINKAAGQTNNNKPLLKKGMRDSELGADYIKSWQLYLSTLGFSTVGLPDGVFGQKTEDAVMQYQAAYNTNHKDKPLIVDGIIGPATWATIL